MKTLIIDRDSLSTQLIKAKLEELGHTVHEETVKNDAIARLEEEPFDVVCFDPAPLNNARPIILGIRRSMRNYPYVLLMSHDTTRENAIKSGANDVLVKPFDSSGLEEQMQNADRLTKLVARIGDDSEDFPSAGGVIAKSAFNQLFLSALDRADRYSERSYLVFIGIENHQDILEKDGRYPLEYATAKFSQYLVRLRRQSDIIAQTGKSEYVLMLQRPSYDGEPLEAASRFAEALNKLEDICSDANVKIEVSVRLIDLPVGQLHAEHIVKYSHPDAK